MGTPPSGSVLTLASSLSTHVTRWPISAKQTAATSPTYPDPITQIETDLDICGFVSFLGLHRTKRLVLSVYMSASRLPVTALHRQPASQTYLQCLRVPRFLK